MNTEKEIENDFQYYMKAKRKGDLPKTPRFDEMPTKLREQMIEVGNNVHAPLGNISTQGHLSHGVVVPITEE